MGRMPDLTWDTVTALAGLANALSDCLNEPPGPLEGRASEIVSRSRLSCRPVLAGRHSGSSGPRPRAKGSRAESSSYSRSGDSERSAAQHRLMHQHRTPS